MSQVEPPQELPAPEPAEANDSSFVEEAWQEDTIVEPTQFDNSMATQDPDQFMNWWDWTQAFPGDIVFSGMIIATIVTVAVGLAYLTLSIIIDGRADKYQLIGKGTDVIVACSLQLGVAIAVLSLSNVGADLGTDIAI